MNELERAKSSSVSNTYEDYLKKLLTFSVLIWVLAAVALFFLVGLPPLQDAWAYCFWEKAPCKIVTEPNGRISKFVFAYEGNVYNCRRVNFWDRGSGVGGTASWLAPQGTPTTDFDKTCYVSPKNPLSAVLFLDAHKHWDRALDSLFIAVFVIGVAAVLTFVSRKARRAKSHG